MTPSLELHVEALKHVTNVPFVHPVVFGKLVGKNHPSGSIFGKRDRSKNTLFKKTSFDVPPNIRHEWKIVNSQPFPVEPRIKLLQDCGKCWSFVHLPLLNTCQAHTKVTELWMQYWPAVWMKFIFNLKRSTIQHEHGEFDNLLVEIWIILLASCLEIQNQ